MKYSEFVDCLYEAVDCEGYINRESKYIQTIEEVVGIDFKCLTNEEIFALIQGMRIMYEMERESWRYFKMKEKSMKFNSQEDFTDKINKLILEGKEQGFSTKGISDKWHTFEELYYHRMILTYIVLKNYQNLSWKSKQHHDGTMFDDSFIVGINTPEGQYTYHYDLERWDLFDIRELDKAPIYDGHKPEDIVRLMSLL